MNKEYLEIGKIVNTFGLKGELKIASDSDFLDYRFRKGAKIYLKIANKYTEFSVSSLRFIKGNACITLNDMFDINQVTMYVGLSVYVDASDEPPLEDDEFYIDDLVGLDVYLENGEKYGIVNDVIIIPSNDVLEIKRENGELILIPFIDDYVLEVNDDNIVIAPYEVAN